MQNTQKNIINEDRVIDMNKEEEPPYFKSHFHELFGNTTKGSQVFRKILKYDNPEPPTYDTEVWKKSSILVKYAREK